MIGVRGCNLAVRWGSLWCRRVEVLMWEERSCGNYDEEGGVSSWFLGRVEIDLPSLCWEYVIYCINNIVTSMKSPSFTLARRWTLVWLQNSPEASIWWTVRKFWLLCLCLRGRVRKSHRGRSQWWWSSREAVMARARGKLWWVIECLSVSYVLFARSRVLMWRRKSLWAGVQGLASSFL